MNLTIKGNRCFELKFGPENIGIEARAKAFLERCQN
jgi:hypothetical protein